MSIALVAAAAPATAAGEEGRDGAQHAQPAQHVLHAQNAIHWLPQSGHRGRKVLPSHVQRGEEEYTRAAQRHLAQRARICVKPLMSAVSLHAAKRAHALSSSA